MALTIEQINNLNAGDTLWTYYPSWGHIGKAEIRSIERMATVVPNMVSTTIYMKDRGIWDDKDLARPEVFLTEEACKEYAKANPSRLELAEQRDAKLRAQGLPVPGEEEDEDDTEED
jgi:hypothetical protein